MDTTVALRGLLKRYRQERGLTQDEFAERVGCATQTIRKIEGGQRRPSYAMAQRMAQVLALAPPDQAAWVAALRETEEEPDAPELAAPAAQQQTASLPIYLTPFVGREHEQADLAHLLATDTCRLITLIGPGGIGKTRLAVEAARHATGFADGMAFVALAPVATPQAIVPAIGNALGFSFSGNADLLNQLLAYLRERHVLLILDNLEHLLDSAGHTLGLIEHILAHTSCLRVIVTSRERLKLTAAWVREIEGLPVPPADTRKHWADYAALTLFAEHAQRVQQSFQINAQNYAAVAKICQVVGGMPLGIELAAGWLRLLSPDEIGHEMARNLDTAHLSSGTLPARHHSLRLVVDHSWALLLPAERQALRRLSIFHGGFTREAAAQVAEVGLAVLAVLVDKSLLRRAAQGRYDLHEVIRQYAEARQREDQAERAAIHERHATYYLELLADIEMVLKGPQQAQAVAQISSEIDNIRAAWQWAGARGMHTQLEQAAETVFWFYEFRSWHQEGTAQFWQAAQHLRSATPQPSDPARGRVIGRLLAYYGFHASRTGDFARAGEALAESYVLLDAAHDSFGVALNLIFQGIVAHWTGDNAVAHQVLEQSHAIACATNDTWLQVLSKTWLSIVAHAQGNYAEAEHWFRAALPMFHALGTPRGLVWCVTACSATLIVLGKYQEAQTLLRESLISSQATDDRYGMSMSLQHLGLIALHQHDTEEAVYLFRETLALVRMMGTWELAKILNYLATALWQLGAHTEAGKTYRDALAAAQAIRAAPDMLHALLGLAMLRAQQQHYAAGLELVVYIQDHVASRPETRAEAAQLGAVILPHLTHAQRAEITERAKRSVLEAVVDTVLKT